MSEFEIALGHVAEAVEILLDVDLGILDALGDFNFLLAGEQGDLAHLLEIHPNGVVEDVELLGFCVIGGSGVVVFLVLEAVHVGGVDDIELHTAETLVDAFDVGGLDHVLGKEVVDVVVSEVALLFGKLDEFANDFLNLGRVEPALGLGRRFFFGFGCFCFLSSRLGGSWLLGGRFLGGLLSWGFLGRSLFCGWLLGGRFFCGSLFRSSFFGSGCLFSRSCGFLFRCCLFFRHNDLREDEIGGERVTNGYNSPIIAGSKAHEGEFLGDSSDFRQGLLLSCSMFPISLASLRRVWIWLGSRVGELSSEEIWSRRFWRDLRAEKAEGLDGMVEGIGGGWFFEGGGEGEGVFGGEVSEEAVDGSGLGGVGAVANDADEGFLAGEIGEGVDEAFGLLAEPVLHLFGLEGELAEEENAGIVVAGFDFFGSLFFGLIALFFFGAGEGFAELGEADAEAGGAVGEEGVAHDGVGDFFEVDGEGVGEAAAIEGLAEVDVLLGKVDLVVEEAAGAVEEGAEGFGAFRFDEGVGVLFFGKGGDADFEAEFGEFGKGFASGFVTGGVGVVAEDDFVGVALDEAGVVGGEGGAEAGNGVFEAGFVTGDDVDLSFADEGEFFASDDFCAWLCRGRRRLSIF